MRLCKTLVAFALALAPTLAVAQVGQQPGVTSPPTASVGGTITAPILGASGCAAPPFSFTDDPGAGMCFLGFNTLNVQTGVLGAESIGRLNLGPSVSSLASITAGLVATGIFADNSGVGTVTLRTAGVDRFTLTNAILTSTVPFRAPDGSGAASAYSFTSDTDMGMFKDGTTLNVASAEYGVAAGGTVFLAPTFAQLTHSVPGFSDTYVDLSGTGAASAVVVGTDGTERLRVSTTNVVAAAAVTFRGPVGTGATNPLYGFTGDEDTGVFSSGANTLDLAAGGFVPLQIGAGFVTFNGSIAAPLLLGFGTAGAPAYSFNTDTNTGLYRSAADEVSVSAGGTARVTVSTAAVTAAVPLVTTSAVPTSPSCTGLGTGSAAMDTGSSSTAGTFVLSPTGAPGSSGICTATFAAPLGTNTPVCVAICHNVAGSVWEVEPTVRIANATSTTTLSIAWDNNGTALTAGGAYKISYICVGK